MIFEFHVKKQTGLKTGVIFFQTWEEFFVIFRSKPAYSPNDLKAFPKKCSSELLSPAKGKDDQKNRLALKK